MLRRTALFGTLLLVMFAGAATTGQTDMGRIGGVIADERGTPIAGAEILIRDSMHDKTFHATSDDKGVYVVPDLNSGRYSLRARAKEHSEIWICEIVVRRGEHANQNVTLVRSRLGRQQPVPVCPPEETPHTLPLKKRP